MSQREISICLWCKHYNGDIRCAAFPAGIPEQLYPLISGTMATFDHRYPYEGDNNIQFELEDDFEKIKDNSTIRLLAQQPQGIQGVYNYLEILFKLYDKRREQGFMLPKDS